MKYIRSLSPLRNKFDGMAFSIILGLIILFLLLQSSIIFKPGVSIQLPSPDTAQLPGIVGPTIVIGIDQNDQYYFNGKNVTLDNLMVTLERAREKNPVTSVVIVSDQEASINTFANLGALTYKAGLTNILIATNPNQTVENNPTSNTSSSLP